jgi:uncharacterized membrane protein
MKINSYIAILNAIMILVCSVASITNLAFMTLVYFGILSASCLPYVILGTGIVSVIVMLTLLLELPVMVFCRCIERCKKRHQQDLAQDDVFQHVTPQNATNYTPEKIAEVITAEFKVSVTSDNEDAKILH